MIVQAHRQKLQEPKKLWEDPRGEIVIVTVAAGLSERGVTPVQKEQQMLTALQHGKGS